MTDTVNSYTTLTRFFAHLCLFLQLIDVPVPPDATQIILEVYLQVLEVLSAICSHNFSLIFRSSRMQDNVNISLYTLVR